MEELLTGGEGGGIRSHAKSHCPAQMHFFIFGVFLFVFRVRIIA